MPGEKWSCVVLSVACMLCHKSWLHQVWSRTWSSHAQEGNKTRSEDRKQPDVHVAQKLKLITLQLGHCSRQAPSGEIADKEGGHITAVA